MTSDIMQTDGIVQSIDNLNNQAYELRHTDQKKSAELAKNALNLSSKAGYKSGLGYALLNSGFQEFASSLYREAFTTFNQALNVFRDLGDPAGIAHAYYNLGLV